MEILQAFDLTGSLRSGAALVGCDHETVARLVAAGAAEAGDIPVRVRSRPLMHPFGDKIARIGPSLTRAEPGGYSHSVLVAVGYAFVSDDAAGGRGTEAVVMRVIGGVPTHAPTDNEKTVTVEHVCGIAVRNATIVEVSRHYGLTIATCAPADPAEQGGLEATVRMAKADLGPTDHNLREEYPDWRRLSRRASSSWPT